MLRRITALKEAIAVTRKPEAIFQSKIIAYLRKLYGSRFWYANQIGALGTRSGVPDLLICIDGQFIALEINPPHTGGRLGPKQQKEIAAIQQASGIARVIRSWEDLVFLTERFRPTQKTIRQNSMEIAQ